MHSLERGDLNLVNLGICVRLGDRLRGRRKQSCSDVLGTGNFDIGLLVGGSSG